MRYILAPTFGWVIFDQQPDRRADISINPLRLQPKIIGNPFIGDIVTHPQRPTVSSPNKPSPP